MAVIVAIAIAVAVLLVVTTRGSFRQLARLELRWLHALFLALGIRVGLEILTIPRDRVDTWGFALLFGSYALLLAFCAANSRYTGMTIVMIGLACNTAVIAANRAMPYRAAVGTANATTVEHRPERPDDRLRLLDDHIVLPRPLEESISYGDLILAVGLVDVIYRASRATRDERSERAPATA